MVINGQSTFVPIIKTDKYNSFLQLMHNDLTFFNGEIKTPHFNGLASDQNNLANDNIKKHASINRNVAFNVFCDYELLI